MSKEYDSVSVESLSATAAIFHWSTDGAELLCKTLDFSAPARREPRKAPCPAATPLAAGKRTFVSDSDASALRARLYGPKS
jgi:hypothetical protein